MNQEQKAKLKEKIVNFVQQTQEGGPNPVSFNEFSRQNPDRKGILNKQEALKTALKLATSGTLRLVSDNDNMDQFNHLAFLELIEKNDHASFIEGYSRFLARTDIMGASYFQEGQTYLGKIYFEPINKISDYIMGLDYKTRNSFCETFSTYLRFEMMRIKDLIAYTKKVGGSMDEEGTTEEEGVLPASWKERGRYIGRYLSILFAHQFIFESDVFSSIDSFAEFLTFCFNLLKGNDEEFVKFFFNFSIDFSS